MTPNTTHIHYTINLNLPGSERSDERLDKIERKLGEVVTELEQMQQNISDINTATNTIADEITTLQASVGNGIAPADADAVNQQLAGIAARLKSIGTPATPAGSVPPTSPTPTVAVNPADGTTVAAPDTTGTTGAAVADTTGTSAA